MKLRFFSFGLLFLSAFAWGAEPLKVAVALRSAPELNSSSESLRNGITLAAEVFNAENKTENGLQIELVPYPHQSAHDSLSEAGKKMVEDHVQYVLGAEMSDDAFALAEEFQNKNVLLMSATASVPHLTSGHPLVFRACLTDDQVALDLAKYAASLKNVHSIGVIHNTVNAYTDSVTNAFLENYETLTRKAPTKIHEFRYATETPNFESAVEQFKKANVDLVVAFTLTGSLKIFYTAATKIGFNPTYLGSDGWGTNESVLHQLVETQLTKKFVGVRAEHWNPDAKLPAVNAFKAAYQKKFARQPDGSSAVAYDSAILLFEAIAKTKNPKDVSEVAANLRSSTFTRTVTAKQIRFNRKNGPEAPLYLYQLDASGAKFIKSME